MGEEKLAIGSIAIKERDTGKALEKSARDRIWPRKLGNSRSAEEHDRAQKGNDRSHRQYVAPSCPLRDE
jgi:hypothetical protein